MVGPVFEREQRAVAVVLQRPQVVVHGSEDTKLNGKKGLVMDFDHKSGQYKVDLIGEGDDEEAVLMAVDQLRRDEANSDDVIEEPDMPSMPTPVDFDLDDFAETTNAPKLTESDPKFAEADKQFQQAERLVKDS